MLLSVSADVKQATIVHVNEVPEVVVQDEGHRQKRRLTFRSAAETKSKRCVKSAPVNPEKNISGQRNYNRSRRSWGKCCTDSMPTIVRRLQGEGTVKIYVWILEVTHPNLDQNLTF